mmetsp:Transcript_24519/g.42159  ORF Transcript_24519/g.42159 Transcript_24519/m.42159 type:complete len:150 (-) Transcript_24519:3-452(-)
MIKLLLFVANRCLEAANRCFMIAAFLFQITALLFNSCFPVSSSAAFHAPPHQAPPCVTFKLNRVHIQSLPRFMLRRVKLRRVSHSSSTAFHFHAPPRFTFKLCRMSRSFSATLHVQLGCVSSSSFAMLLLSSTVMFLCSIAFLASQPNF